MNTLKKIWAWIKYSSANAEKISMTVKGFLYGIVPAVLFFAHIFNIQLTNETLSLVIDQISVIIIVIGGTISSALMVVGLIRKVWYTIIGKNEVIASFNGR